MVHITTGWSSVLPFGTLINVLLSDITSRKVIIMMPFAPKLFLRPNTPITTRPTLANLPGHARHYTLLNDNKEQYYPSPVSRPVLPGTFPPPFYYTCEIERTRMRKEYNLVLGRRRWYTYISNVAIETSSSKWDTFTNLFLNRAPQLFPRIFTCSTIWLTWSWSSLQLEYKPEGKQLRLFQTPH